MWTMEQLRRTVTMIKNEIMEFNNRWKITFVKTGDGGLSTIQAHDGRVPQNKRRYKINVNTDNPLNYQVPGVLPKTMVNIGVVHEQTHALCDMSYTCNTQASRLGTWNSINRTYDIGEQTALDAADRMEELFNKFDQDNSVTSLLNIKDKILDRISYGGSNVVDIDTVVNELCFVVNLPNMNIANTSPFVEHLLYMADLNLANRKQGRLLQRT